MSSIVDTLFGGTDKSSQRAQLEQNELARQAIEAAQAQSRQDALSLFPSAAQNRNLGFQSALDVFGQTIPGQLDAFQSGNVGAQEAILAGLPQVQNAIFGLPTDLSGLQPQRLDINTGFAQQQLPEFVNPQLTQAGALGGVPAGQAQQPGGRISGALAGIPGAPNTSRRF